MKKGYSILLGCCTTFMLFSSAQTYAISFGSGSSSPLFLSMPPIDTAPNSNTPTPSPQTQTKTTTTIYSGQVRPPGGTNSSTSIEAKHAGVDIPSKSITNEQYANLPTCPGTPACPPYTMPPMPFAVVCPDINGKMPDGSTPTTPPDTCPDYCKVQRCVVESTVGQVTSVTFTRAAACPDQYVAVGVYAVGKEIAYNGSPPYAPFPIATRGIFDQYMTSGYTCETYYAGTYEQCGGSFSVPVADPPSPFAAYSYPNTAPSLVAGGYVGYYTANNSNPNFCKAPFPPCGNFCDSAWVDTDTKYSYPYKYIKCKPPAGLYYTGNTVPTALVCAVRKATWQKLN